MTVVIVIVVVVILIVAVMLYFAATAPNVQVVAINIYSPDNACGQSASPGYYGFNDTPGSDQALELPLTNYNTTPCQIVGVTTNSSGFGVIDAEVPVTMTGGGSNDLNLTLTLPGSSYSGVVNLILS